MHRLSFAELAAATFPVVTPGAASARLLATALGADLATGARPAPDVLGFTAWASQACAERRLAGSYSGGFLLGAEQERALWRSVVVAAGGPAEAAPLAIEAWRLAHDYAIDWRAGPPPSEDADAFRRWAGRYLERSAELEAVELARAVLAVAAAPATSARFHGWPEAPPALRPLLGTGNDGVVADPRRFDGRAFVDRDAELAAAFAWAAETAATAPAARVVVAVENLAQEHQRVRRCLEDVLGSSAAVATSLAEPLLSVPAIVAAFDFLSLDGEVRWDSVSRILTSPHLGGAEREELLRARLDAHLREAQRYAWPLAALGHAVGAAEPACPLLVARLAALEGELAAAPRRARFGEWRAHFERCLDACGWPGGQAGEANAQVARNAMGELGDRLQRLDAVLTPVSRGAALTVLRQLAAEAGAPGVPARAGCFFVVSPAEALALAPEHLWLAGAEASAFGASGRPSPLLPLAAQRAAGVPGADAGRDLARARRLLAALAGGAGSRIASYSAGDGDAVHAPSPLLPSLAGAPVTGSGPRWPVHWLPLPAETAAERVDDSHGSALIAGASVAGGVAVLAAQSACPFRAYARHRLRARPLEEPGPGLAASRRGVFVHRALAWLWARIHDQATLLGLDADARARHIDTAISRAFDDWQFLTTLERELGAVERARLARLLERWLDFEAARAPFTVRAVERPATVRFGDLELRTRIDRLDRLADGTERIVDYKTGTLPGRAWEPPRLDEPQLPFYALTQPSRDLAAIAFARVDVARPEWRQRPAEDGEPAQVATDWAAALVAWGADLAALAAEIRAGLAVVAPKRGSQTCRLCEQPLLCRVHELAPDADDGEEAGDDA